MGIITRGEDSVHSVLHIAVLSESDYVMNFPRVEMSNKSGYHAFNITKEAGEVKLRAKQFLFLESWTPVTGLKLLKDLENNEPFPTCGIADFRVESLNLDQVFLDLNKFYSTMSLAKRMRVQTSWDSLRKRLESLPSKIDSMEKLRIQDFVVQTPRLLFFQRISPT